MTDKEVGELWRKCLKGLISSSFHIEHLICKLIEERAAVHDHGDYSNDDQHKVYIEQACRDFGIDPEEYAKEKSK